jgi:exopolysaccharide production protein ExoY
MDMSNESEESKYSPSPKGILGLCWRRTLDAFLILLALPFLVPLVLLVVLYICVSSPGLGIFMPERVGFWGKHFKCFTFRTMFEDAGTATHQGHLLQPMQSNMPIQNLVKRQ